MNRKLSFRLKYRDRVVFDFDFADGIKLVANSKVTAPLGSKYVSG